MNILITSAGQRVSLVKAFQKEAANLNPNSKVYTVDSNPALAPACHVSDGFKTIAKVTAPEYIESLLAICQQWGIKIIIPTIDTELMILAKHKTLLQENGITPIISNPKLIKICRDKRLSNAFFNQHNINTPAGIDKHNPTFPLFIKPYDGSLSKDTFTIRHHSELNEYHMNNPKLMFMEYIPPEHFDEYTVDTYYDKHGHLKCAVPRKRIFVRAGEINKGVTSKNPIVDCLKKNLAQIPGACGCLTMQFFYNANTQEIFAIEINARFGGGFPLSYFAGANYPRWIIQEYLYNKTLDYYDDWEDKLLMLRYDHEVLISDYPQ